MNAKTTIERCRGPVRAAAPGTSAGTGTPSLHAVIVGGGIAGLASAYFLYAAKRAALELCRGLGLEDEILPANDALRRTYVPRGRRLIPLPDALELLVPTRIAPTRA